MISKVISQDLPKTSNLFATQLSQDSLRTQPDPLRISRWFPQDIHKNSRFPNVFSNDLLTISVVFNITLTGLPHFCHLKSRILTGIVKFPLDLTHWNASILTRIPKSSLESQDPRWNPKIYTRNLISILDPQRNPRKLNIPTGVPTLGHFVEWH